MSKLSGAAVLLVLAACAREGPDQGKALADSVAAAPASDSGVAAPNAADAVPSDTIMVRDTAQTM